MTIVRCPKCQTDTPHQYSGTATRDSEGWTTQPMRCAICTTEIKFREPPGVVYEFIGGPLDGRTVTGAEAEAWHTQTADGEIGKRFTPAGTTQVYEVLKRKVMFGEVLVRVGSVEAAG